MILSFFRKIMKMLILDYKLLLSKRFEGFEGYEKITSSETFLFKNIYPIVFIIFSIQLIYLEITDILPNPFKLFYIGFLYIGYNIFVKYIKLKIVFWNERNLLVVDSFNQKIIPISYSQIYHVRGAVFSEIGIVKVILDDEVNGLKRVSYVGTRKGFRFFDEHYSVDEIKKKSYWAKKDI